MLRSMHVNFDNELNLVNESEHFCAVKRRNKQPVSMFFFYIVVKRFCVSCVLYPASVKSASLSFSINKMREWQDEAETRFKTHLIKQFVEFHVNFNVTFCSLCLPILLLIDPFGCLVCLRSQGVHGLALCRLLDGCELWTFSSPWAAPTNSDYDFLISCAGQ